MLTQTWSTTPTLLPTMISVIPSITAVCNALGRIGYSTVSDKLKDRSSIYIIIFCSCIAICGFTYFTEYPALASVVLLMIINLGYGGGFSTLPALLDSRFGMENISKIHGLALSAWAVAGLTGNNLSELLLKNSDNNYNVIIAVACALYVVALLICLLMVKERKNHESI